VTFAGGKTNSSERVEERNEGIDLITISGNEIYIRPGCNASRAFLFTGWPFVSKTSVGIIDVKEPEDNPYTDEPPETGVETGPDFDH